jgi:hypothetical protein
MILTDIAEQCFVDPIFTSQPTISSTETAADNTSASMTTSANNPSSSATTSRHRPPLTVVGSDHPPTWGLTLSGFYYIALNRITGSIDGLYYDPGSQPYQSLSMSPLKPTYSANSNPLPSTQGPGSSTAPQSSADAVPSSSTALASNSGFRADGENKGIYMKGSRARAIRHQRGVLSEGDVRYDHDHGRDDRNGLTDAKSRRMSPQEVLLVQGVGIRRAWPAIEFR